MANVHMWKKARKQFRDYILKLKLKKKRRKLRRKDQKILKKINRICF